MFWINDRFPEIAYGIVWTLFRRCINCPSGSIRPFTLSGFVILLVKEYKESTVSAIFRNAYIFGFFHLSPLIYTYATFTLFLHFWKNSNVPHADQSP